jgi:IclR family acetate operon transcriptional repressor
MTEATAVQLQPGTVPDAAAARNSSSSLRRALGLLMYVAKHGAEPEGASLTQISGALEMSKSTALRLATPLVEAGLLVRTPARGHFRLGSGALQLGQAYLDGLDLRSVAKPFLARLLSESGNTCHLVVRDGMDVVYIDKVENQTAVRMASRIGKRMPLQCTAVGKSILAFSGPTLVKEVLETGLPAITPWSITDPELFRQELDKTLKRGYSIDDRENEPEVRCVAAPVFDHDDAVVGALSVSGLTSWLTVARVRVFGARVSHTGLEISAQLGSPRARRLLAGTRPHPPEGLR